MSGGSEAFDLLERIRETDQTWRMPRGSPTTELECAIVITTAHAEANAACIEAEEGKEHDIEPACTHHSRAFGLVYPKAVASLTSCQLHEAHLAAECVAVDARYIDVATTTARELDERRGIEFCG